MNPVIFLDIDGVVVTPRSLAEGGPKHADSSCVANLNRLVEAAHAEVVISSSWRTAHSIDFIRETLCASGFSWPERIIGMTEHMHYRVEHGSIVGRAERSDEIRAWLDRHPREQFVILDDDLEAEITGHFIRTEPDWGLRLQELEAALKILKQIADGLEREPR
jgi:ribosomal protein L31E